MFAIIWGIVLIVCLANLFKPFLFKTKRGAFFASAFTAVFLVMSWPDGSDVGGGQSLTAEESAQAQTLRTLRDEAIRHIGWVAGNAEGHPIWPQVRPYVGERGEYYNTFVSLAPKGSDPEVEAFSNVSLYRKWRDKGREVPFNEQACIEKIERVLQITKELTNKL